MLGYIFNTITLGLFIIGCSIFGTEDKKQEINIANKTTSSIMVDVWDMESSNTLDPNPVVAIDKVSFQKIDPNGKVSISRDKIKGYNNEGEIRIFLYRIERDSAYYQKSFSLPIVHNINIFHNSDGYYIES